MALENVPLRPDFNFWQKIDRHWRSRHGKVGRKQRGCGLGSRLQKSILVLKNFFLWLQTQNKCIWISLDSWSSIRFEVYQFHQSLSLSLWPLKQCLKTDILCSNFYRREKKLIRSFYSYFKFTSKMISSYSNGNGRETKEIVCVRERACKVLERES